MELEGYLKEPLSTSFKGMSLRVCRAVFN